MDIYCPRCAEPMDITEFHTLGEEGSIGYGGMVPETPEANVPEGSSYNTAKNAFLSYGCEALGLPKCEKSDDPKAYIMSAVGDLFGDDLDGLAADLEDFEALGLL
jgi:hypothetical protein